MRPICIYHGKCADGFTAAWAVKCALGDIEFYPGVYQEPPPEVTGRDVIIVDFSYKRPVLVEMAAVARSILVLDHHKTAAEDLAG
ncbi:MAG TPA: phosphoesterase, partial [Paralcaligenes sp.]